MDLARIVDSVPTLGGDLEKCNSAVVHAAERSLNLWEAITCDLPIPVLQMQPYIVADWELQKAPRRAFNEPFSVGTGGHVLTSRPSALSLGASSIVRYGSIL